MINEKRSKSPLSEYSTFTRSRVSIKLTEKAVIDIFGPLFGSLDFPPLSVQEIRIFLSIDVIGRFKFNRVPPEMSKTDL